MKLKEWIIILIAFAILGAAIAAVVAFSKFADAFGKDDPVFDDSSNDNIVSDANGGSSSLSGDTSFSPLYSYSVDVNESNTDNYKFCAVCHENGKQAMLGIMLTDLKPNTKYRIDWVINPAIYQGTGMSIRYSSETNQYEFYIDTDYVANTGLGTILTMGSGKGFDGMLESSWTFTSADEGDVFTFFFAHAKTVDVATLKEYSDIIAENFSFRLYVVEE